jgi:hypothetical protein
MSSRPSSSDKNAAHLHQELAELVESPPAGITVELANESNLYEWKVYMEGPENSPYAVRTPVSTPCLGVTLSDTLIHLTERQIPGETQPPQRIPI